MSQSRDDTHFYLEKWKTIFDTLLTAFPFFSAVKDELVDKSKSASISMWGWWVFECVCARVCASN